MRGMIQTQDFHASCRRSSFGVRGRVAHLKVMLSEQRRAEALQMGLLTLNCTHLSTKYFLPVSDLA